MDVYWLRERSRDNVMVDRGDKASVLSVSESDGATSVISTAITLTPDEAYMLGSILIEWSRSVWNREQH